MNKDTAPQRHPEPRDDTPTVGTEVLKTKRTERGWPGHFCCARRCNFRRNTLLEYGGVRLIVSTVGAFIVDDKFETVGHKRYYETVVFVAEDSTVDGAIYTDTVCTAEISCQGIQQGIDHCGRSADGEANDMHENVVDYIIARMEAGEFDEVNQDDDQ